MFFGWPSKMRAQRKQLFFAGKDLALVCFGQVSEVQHCWRLQDPSKIHSTQQSARPCLQPEPPLRLARIRDFDGCNNSGGKSCALTFLGKMQPVESSGICSLSSLSLFLLHPLSLHTSPSFPSSLRVTVDRTQAAVFSLSFCTACWRPSACLRSSGSRVWR